MKISSAACRILRQAGSLSMLLKTTKKFGRMMNKFRLLAGKLFQLGKRESTFFSALECHFDLSDISQKLLNFIIIFSPSGKKRWWLKLRCFSEWNCLRSLFPREEISDYKTFPWNLIQLHSSTSKLIDCCRHLSHLLLRDQWKVEENIQISDGTEWNYYGRWFSSMKDEAAWAGLGVG